jgi:hypothetical protein
MKQVYTVKTENKLMYLHNRDEDCICPHNDADCAVVCGDWCPMFEFADAFTDEGPYMMEHEASVTLHCCGRVIPVEVVE